MASPNQEPTLAGRLQSGDITFLTNLTKPDNRPVMVTIPIQDPEAQLKIYREQYGDEAVIVGDAHDRETQLPKAQSDMIGVYVTTQAFEASRRAERKEWLGENTTAFLDKVNLDPRVVEDFAPTIKELIYKEVTEPEKGFDEDLGNEEDLYRKLSINVVSPTALLATMFSTEHESLPKKWKEDPEIARRLLMATAQVEAGLKRARKSLARYDSPEREAIESEAQTLDEYAKALDNQLISK
jgi:hypothetical protein